MSIGTVVINNLNLMQGALPAVERYLLFVGAGTQDVGKLLTLNTDTDLDSVLGDAADLRIQLEYARNNAGQDWNACAVVYNPALESGIKSWADAVDVAMELASVEGVILTEPLKAVSDVEAMQAKGEAIMGKYMRPLWFGGRAPAFDPETQSWADYATAIKPLTADVAADTCLVTPSIWGYELGTLAGRLCNAAVTVADSPMRVATGALGRGVDGTPGRRRRAAAGHERPFRSRQGPFFRAAVVSGLFRNILGRWNRSGRARRGLSGHRKRTCHPEVYAAGLSVGCGPHRQPAIQQHARQHRAEQNLLYAPPAGNVPCHDHLGADVPRRNLSAGGWGH